MYFFFHLFTGIILGLLLGELLKDRRWILPCAIGSVLPDLIDKPVGFILLGGIIDNGRIWCHSLVFAAIVLVAGVLVGKVKKTPVLIAAAIGILSHQILDLMWRQPVTWYYPLLGPFAGTFPPGHLMALLLNELKTPSEWLLAALILAAAFLRPARIAALVHRHPRGVQGILGTAAVLLLILAGMLMGLGLTRRFLTATGWSRPEEYLIGGIVIALAAFALWRYQLRLQKTGS